MNRIAIFMHGNPVALHGNVSVFRSKAQAFLFLDGEVRSGWCVVLAQKEHHPGSFTRSEIAAYMDRLQHDRPDPDWYADLKRAERLSGFKKSQPNEQSSRVYETFFRR